RPRRGVRPARANGLRRPGHYHPRLEILEERLPPGDTVLGALLLGEFTGPRLDDWDSSPSPQEEPLSAGLVTQYRPNHATVWPFLEEDRIARSSPLAPSPAPSEQLPRGASIPGASVPAGDAEPGWDALSPVSPAGGASPVSALAGSLGFNSTLAAATYSFSA